jgi:hypothetical protein
MCLRQASRFWTAPEAQTDASATKMASTKHIPGAKPGAAQPMHAYAYTYCHMQCVRSQRRIEDDNTRTHAYTYCHMQCVRSQRRIEDENTITMDHVHLSKRLVLHLYRLDRKKRWTRSERYGTENEIVWSVFNDHIHFSFRY